MAQARGAKTTEEAAAGDGGAGIFGDPDDWKLICSYKSKRVYRSTKALFVQSGCLIQVSTVHYNDDGTVAACAEALQFVEGLTEPKVLRDGDEIVGRQLVQRPMPGRAA